MKTNDFDLGDYEFSGHGDYIIRLPKNSYGVYNRFSLDSEYVDVVLVSPTHEEIVLREVYRDGDAETLAKNNLLKILNQNYYDDVIS